MDYFLNVLEQTGLQLLLFLGPALALAFIMQIIASGTERAAYRLLGSKLYLTLFGWFGVVVHESGHALFCLIFRHKIIEVQWFKPDPDNGTLGYVKHSYDPSSFYQKCGNFFIGIGPILLGSLIIFISAQLLMASSMEFRPVAHSIDPLSALLEGFNGAWTDLKSLFQIDVLTRWQTYLFLYISFSVGSNITLSQADIKGAMSGFISLTFVLFFINLLTLSFADFGNNIYLLLAPYYQFFYAIMCFVILINLCFRLILFPFSE